ncbi:hypothetical protein BDZ97DRAFT_1917165 [Flammula alnicola]|nr:hypothetical protein BDZ97DRAFT_1917165 [Flammula alnicola]
MTSSPGYISLSAIAVLASPRPVDPQRGSRNVVFDANFYITEGSQTSSLALLRYFVPDDMMNAIPKMSEKAFQKAFVVANISSITKDTISEDLVTEDLEISDYAFVGDILQTKLILIDGDANDKTRPYIDIAGVVTRFNNDDHSFNMSPTQYVSLPHTSSTFPLRGFFIESKRWGEGKKPKVMVGSTIAFSGFIDKIMREHDTDRTMSSVEIEVANIAYLSNRTNPSIVPNRSTTRAAGSRTRWNYNDPPMSHGDPNASRTSQQNVSSSITDKKRKRDDNSDDTATETATDDEKKD